MNKAEADVLGEGVDEDRFDRYCVTVFDVQFSPAARVAEVCPVGRFVAGPCAKR